MVQTIQRGHLEQEQMEKAHAISNWDPGIDVASEITKNYIRSGINENNNEVGVKILKE